MMLGLTARTSSTSMPSLRRAWGLKLVRKTSAVAQSLSSSSRPSGVPHVDAHAALAPVRELHHVGDAAGTGRDQAHGGQATLGVAALGVLDLDDVGTPLGEHRPGHWHIRPRGDLDHSDAVHDSHNWFFPLTRFGTGFGTRFVLPARSCLVLPCQRSVLPARSCLRSVRSCLVRCRRPGCRPGPGPGPGENGGINVAGHDGTHRAPVGDQVLTGDVGRSAAVEEEQRVGLLGRVWRGDRGERGSSP